MNPPLYIIDGVRTPFCKAGTDLAGESAADLGSKAVGHLLARTGVDPGRIEQVIAGCVGQPAGTANIARVVALRAGIPVHVPAVTVHRNCASGLEVLTQAHQMAAAGRGEVFVLAATESMSQYPLLYRPRTASKLMKLARARGKLEKVRALARLRPRDFRPDPALRLGLTDPTCGLNMGQTAENLAREFGVPRHNQDLYSLYSHRRAVAARGRLREEVFPLYPDSANGSAALVENDNGPREQQSEEALSNLKPVFDRPHGTVTAGNASQVTDGAVALLVMSASACEKYGRLPLGRLVDYAYVGCDARRMGLGPVYAIHALRQRTGLGLQDADLVEINEAFAAQVLAVAKACRCESFCRRELKLKRPLGRIPSRKLNVNGGAIALGHPVGATGARLVLSTLKELQRRKLRRGLVSLCVGGGQGAAAWLEAA